MNMPHTKRTEEQLLLFFYNELNEKERRAMQLHLEQCSTCRQQLEQLQSMRAKLVDTPRITPAEELLLRLNRRVMLEIGDRHSARFAGLRQFIEDVRETLSEALAQPRYQLVAASLTFVIGLYIGRLWFADAGQPATGGLADLVRNNYTLTEGESNDMQKLIAAYLLNTGGLRIENLRPVENGTAGSKQIALKLKMEDDLALKGDLMDPTIQRMLMYSARHDQDAERRQMAVQLLAGLPQNTGVSATLAAVLVHDTDEEVRLLALRKLASRDLTDQTIDAYKLAAMRDPNPTIRRMALERLARNADEQLIPVLVLITTRETDEELRMLAQRTLEKITVKSNVVK